MEDDDNIARLEKDFLEIHGYEVVLEQTGGEYEIIEKLAEDCDMILLDVMLPKGGDGFQICKRLRSELEKPILMISAMGQDTDVILGLGFGADDYITKPFSPPNQLIARVKAHLSRYERLKSGSNIPSESIIEHDEMVINVASQTCEVAGKTVDLTPKEFEILKLMASNKNVVLTKEQIYEAIWQADALGDASTVTVHVKRVREKLHNANPKVEYISTIWGGVGYKFTVQYKS